MYLSRTQKLINNAIFIKIKAAMEKIALVKKLEYVKTVKFKDANFVNVFAFLIIL